MRDKVIALLMKEMGVENPIVFDTHREFYQGVAYNVMIKPLVIKNLKEGLTVSQIAVKYGVTYSVIKRIELGQEVI